MKSKAFSSFISALLLLSLTACGKPQEPVETAGSTAVPVQTEAQTVPETTAANTIAANRIEASEDVPWMAALAEDLFQKYGVLPEYSEELGDGIYQVFVEVGGEIVPFVTVNSATGDYHG